jgi:23S rRNA pseudouridine1911/1915/1917 synthase
MAAATAPPPAMATTLSALLLRPPTKRARALRATHPSRFSSGTTSAEPDEGGHGGARLLEEEAVPAGEGRSRVDAWISARLGSEGVSRARVQASIRAGLVAVNGRPVSKVL